MSNIAEFIIDRLIARSKKDLWHMWGFSEWLHRFISRRKEISSGFL